MGSHLRRIIFAGGALTFLVLHNVSSAQIPYSEKEIALLPEYCNYAQSFSRHGDRAQVEKWTAKLGSTFNNIHHYCYGLMDANFAKLFARTPQERKHRLQTSVGQFGYVIERAPPDFVLLPEIYTKRGESLMALGDGKAAIAEFQRAIEMKRDYWPAYAALSDYFKTSGNRELAREWVDKGLTASPDATALKRRRVELGTTQLDRAKEFQGRH